MSHMRRIMYHNILYSMILLHLTPPLQKLCVLKRYLDDFIFWAKNHGGGKCLPCPPSCGAAPECKAPNSWLLKVGLMLAKCMMPYSWPINVGQMLAIHVIYNCWLHVVGEMLAQHLVAYTT